MSISSLASFGTALRTKGGYWVSVSSQVFSSSPVNLRSEVTETPGWLTGASKEVFPGSGLRNFTRRNQRQWGNRDSNLTAKPAPRRALALSMQEKEASPHGFLPRFQHFATQAIHVGQEPEQWTSQAVVPPISLSTTFKQGAPGQHSGFEYSRSGNPTRNCLEKAVAALDGAKYSLAFASGLAATVTITHLLKAGDQIICMDDVYGGTNRYFRQVATEFGLKISFVDCSKPKLLEAAITPETKLVWIETPTNPSLKMIDIEACAHTVHKHGDIILVVDNTFMSAYFQRPLSLGADICMYSATKYMNGHSDVVMGLVSLNSESLHDRLRFLQNSLGAVPSPIDCYLCNRGLKTLQVRMEKHFENGMAVAQFLESNPQVEKVIYPDMDGGEIMSYEWMNLAL
ncbi:hypothetical protein E5288_WYG007956 [Bos mutus]|uniref:Cystathionine gamma-lyase n=1 Tax=Bos mutus TaxID=72004 RepID=A0A6B0QZH1_9CETA|nr:hypothetical protein [Bos mutus]